jgi:tetratricopeptide (TPR) repeat protein
VKVVLKILAVMLFWCFTNAAQESQPEITLTPDSQDNLKENVYKLYMQANFYHSRGDAKKAIYTYKKLFALKPPIFVFEGYFKFLFDLGQIAKIVRIYQKNEAFFKKDFAKNLEFNLLVAQAFLMANQDDKSEQIFVQLEKDFPDNEQVAYYYAVSLIKNNQLGKCLEHLHTCLQQPFFKPRYFLFHFLRSKVYMQMNNLELAMKEIETSLALFPNFDKALLLKAMLQEQFGMVNEAIKGYQHVLNLVGHDEMVEKQVIQLLFLQNRLPEAVQYLKKLKGSTPEYFFDLALIEFNSGNHKKALTEVNTCIEKNPNFIRAKLLKIEILLAMKDHDQILKIMHDWLMGEPYDNSVIHTLLLLSNSGVSSAKIVDLLKKVASSNKATVGVLAALADLYVGQKDYQNGVLNLKKIFTSTKDHDLKSKVLYQVAYIYFLTNQLKNMENILHQALKHPVVYPAVYNMMAYLYAKKNQNLDQALEFVDKALQTDRNSPFYLDTKGLILSQMGQQKQALELFEKALSILPGDAVILQHMQQITPQR